MKARVLIIEDNQLTARGLQYLLEREGYLVTTVVDLKSAKQTLATQDFELLIMDVGLPDGDSFSLVQQLQDSLKDKAIIFLTARDQEEDIIRGLELGAEDYITKPFRNRELLLRVKKALRQPLGLGKKMTIGHFSLDLEAHELMIDGKIIVLTALEYRIMICLMENAGHIVTRERLLDEIYDASGRVVNDNTLSVYIKRLRRKLRPRDNISTIKNLGYRFEVPQDGGEDV